MDSTVILEAFKHPGEGSLVFTLWLSWPAFSLLTRLTWLTRLTRLTRLTGKVPDPDENMPNGERRYQIYLKSPAGPIDVYVVSQARTALWLGPLTYKVATDY